MKNLKSITTLAVGLLMSISSFGQGSPVEYMNKVTGPISELKTETWKYMKSVTKGKGARKVESKRQELLMGLKSAKRQIKLIKDYKGDEALKNEALEYVTMSITVLDEDFGKILDMEDIAEQSYDLMEAYLLAKEKAGEKLDQASDELNEAQELFAKNNDITLLEAENDRKTEKIKKAGKALEYYNDVYLIFFKCYKQEMYVMEAQSRQDVGAMEQNISTLKSDAEAGLAKLKEMESFDGDNSLVQACEEVLKFYLKESEESFPTMLNFYLAQDNFKKAKETFEATKKKDRTQAIVDKYNNAINDINSAVEEFNEINETSNKERKSALKLWNKSVDKFFSANA